MDHFSFFGIWNNKVQARKTKIESTAYDAIKDQIALINAELETVTGLICKMVEAGAASERRCGTDEGLLESLFCCVDDNKSTDPSNLHFLNTSYGTRTDS